MHSSKPTTQSTLSRCLQDADGGGGAGGLAQTAELPGIVWSFCRTKSAIESITI